MLGPQLDWLLETLLRKEIISVDSAADLPAGAEAEKRAMVRLGVKSLLMAPVALGEKVRYVLSIASLSEPRDWHASLGTRLRALGEILGNALERVRATESLADLQVTGDRVLAVLQSHVALLDPQGRVQAANKSWKSLLPASWRGGCEVGSDYVAVLREAAAKDPAAARALRGLQSVLAGWRGRFVMEYDASTPDTPRWFSLSMFPVGTSENEVAALHADVTQRHLAQEAARELAGRLITALEDERTRIARELHDDVGQRAALLAIELEQLEQKPPRSPARLREQLARARQTVHELSRDLHRLSHRFHPAQLDQLGLVQAVRALGQELSAPGEFRVAVAIGEDPGPLRQEAALALYRIAQEALGNARKHCGAAEALVELGRVGGDVRLAVTDGGRGFDAARASSGLGLVSMRERVRAVGGRLRVESTVGKGTRVEALVPLAGGGTGS
jgi:signal transduction histidine kinase